MTEEKEKPKDEFDTKVISTPQQTMAELIKILGDKDKEKVKMFSDYNEQEIRDFAMLEAFNGVLNSDVLSLYIYNRDTRRCSKDRLSRKELVVTSHALAPQVSFGDIGGSGRLSRLKSLVKNRRF